MFEAYKNIIITKYLLIDQKTILLKIKCGFVKLAFYFSCKMLFLVKFPFPNNRFNYKFHSL